MTMPSVGMLTPGVVLNHTYQIIKLIGEGGTGEVYLAQNQATGREVAIKLLKREFSADPTLVALMQREADALHEVMHPAVVRYYELLRTEISGNAFTFLVMEFIRGESLGDRLARGPLPPEEILQIAARVVSGLEVAHARQVLHRDLTPANVILRDGDPAQATLIDFGIAKDLAQSKHSVIGGGFAGTYQYASPEQIDGRDLDARSDFYSLGATLLAASEGRSAGQGKTLEQIVGEKTRVPDTSHLPALLRPLIEALLQPNPESRPRGAAEIRVLIGGSGTVEDLDALIGGVGAAPEGTIVRPAPPSQAPARPALVESKPRKSSGAFLWVAAILLLGGLGAGGYFLLPELLKPALPTAAPYNLALSVNRGVGTLSGNAPSEDAANALRRALGDVSAAELDGALTPATGMPTESWTAGATELAAAMSRMEQWALTIADQAATLDGTALDPDMLERITRETEAVAETRAFTLDNRIALAPQPLARAAMRAVAAPFAKCGPLVFGGPDPLPPGAAISATGTVASEEDRDRITGALGELDPDRPLDLDLAVASKLVCQVERLMPRANAPQLNFRFAYGRKAGGPQAATYLQGENPVIDVSVDKSFGTAFLYVFYVDGNTGKVIHLLPYKDRTENRVAEAGEDMGARYDVRILFPASDVAVGKRGFLVGPPFGTNILVAVASEQNFLDQLFPRNDAAELFLEDLIEALRRARSTEYVITREFFTTRAP
ncbi:MAG: protein kinase [Pseudomonadota bacterium]